jgi:hypothetical protein
MEIYANRIGFFLKKALRPNISNERGSLDHHYFYLQERDLFLDEMSSSNPESGAALEGGGHELSEAKSTEKKGSVLTQKGTGIETAAHSSQVPLESSSSMQDTIGDSAPHKRIEMPPAAEQDNDQEGLLKGPPKIVGPLQIAGPEKPQHLAGVVNQKGFLLTSIDSFLVDWGYSILIGFLVVTYWRVCTVGKLFESLWISS